MSDSPINKNEQQEHETKSLTNQIGFLDIPSAIILTVLTKFLVPSSVLKVLCLNKFLNQQISQHNPKLLWQDQTRYLFSLLSDETRMINKKARDAIVENFPASLLKKFVQVAIVSMRYTRKLKNIRALILCFNNLRFNNNNFNNNNFNNFRPKDGDICSPEYRTDYDLFWWKFFQSEFENQMTRDLILDLGPPPLFRLAWKIWKVFCRFEWP